MMQTCGKHIIITFERLQVMGDASPNGSVFFTYSKIPWTDEKRPKFCFSCGKPLMETTEDAIANARFPGIVEHYA